MTSISGNSAALSILTQASTLPAGNKSAADTILDIVSGGSTGGTNKAEEARLAKLAAQKAKIAALDQPREAGGTVSSEISAGWTSAMSQVVQGTTLASAPVETQAATQGTTGTAPAQAATASADPWDAAVYDAMSRATLTVALAISINGKFHLEPEVDLDSRLSTIEAQRQSKIADGTSEDVANAQADLLKRAATGAVTHTKMINENRLDQANGALVNYNEILNQAGVEGSVSVDENGRATVSAFDITDSSGRKVVSLGENGRMTTYNADGSVKNELSREDVALATRNINTYAYTLKRSGTDLNQLELF